MYIPKIPNNSLTEEIKEIVSLCMKLEAHYGRRATLFNPPATDVEIRTWEQKNGILLPESYKDWLKFTNGSFILFDLMTTCDLEHISIDSEIVPDNLIVIGTLIGNGQLLCITKNGKTIVQYDHGEIYEIPTFNVFLKNTIIRMLKKS